MIALKPYQERVLDSLRDFFRECSRDGRPEGAFQAVQFSNGSSSPVPYIPVNAAGLSPGMPYVCLRVPTGGGKTLLACYAAGLAMDQLMRAERAVVLWLVPSNTILDQTADALRDVRHPYRRALELACGAVEVVTIEEALRLSRATVEGQTVVIVATIQAFRVEDTTGRKVYDQNGAFAEHLLNVPAGRLADLLPGADGKPKPSLVNMLRLRRPIVIVDEAHNARTDLSFSTLGSVLPSCIIEFTATPARQGTPSNVLHHVSAAELKAADMVKLPLRVITRHPSQRDQLLAEAITLRADLEKLTAAEAQKTGEYLRPILLLQAERVDGCEPLRDRLVSDFGVTKDEVKISVGTLDELKSVTEIASPKCAVRIDAVKGEITVLVPLDKTETEKLASCVKTPEAKAKVEAVVELVREAEKAFGGSGRPRTPSPYELQLDFFVPLLCVRENQDLLEFESTFLLEHPWKLSGKDASLSKFYDPLARPGAEAGYVDVGAKGEVQTRIALEPKEADFVSTLHQHALALGNTGDWTLESLVAWLDRHIDHQDIPAGESAEFLRKVIRGLMAKHGITDLSLLALDRFRLRSAIETRIREHRDGERKAAFRQFLLPDSTLAVSAERALNFRTMIYEPSWLYEGGFQFNKHYFGPKPGELREKTPSGELTEEFKCAQFLDGRPEVKFWVRNPVRNPVRKASSFRLQTSTDWFYPDFLCQLTDGRVLAVEYKGKDRYTAEDAEEKRAVGAVWASRSGGRCAFVMPTDGDFSVIASAARPL